MRKLTSDKNPECPAIAELANTLEASFPSITLLTTNNVSPGTRHTSGLAIDIMLDVTNADQRRLAHGIIDVLVARHAAMKWSDLIYSDYAGGSISYFHIPGGGGFGGKNGMLVRNPYTADTRHGDHIHLDWVDLALKNDGKEYLRIPYKWSKAAENTGFASALTADFRALASGQAAPPAAGTYPTWLTGWWSVVQDGSTYFYFFRPAGSVEWTYDRPRNNQAPMVSPRNKGTYTYSPHDGVAVTWDKWDVVATQETFKVAATGNRAMKGSSNRGGSLAATKL